MPQTSSSSAHVGAELKKRRQALHLSLTTVELETKIRGKYLTAIETGSYETLPNDIYSRGFVHQYAEYLELDGETIVARYLAERGGLEEAETASPRLARPPRLVVTGRVVAIGVVLLVVLVVGSYLAWQFSSLAAPPDIIITSPPANQTVTGSAVTVAGRVTPGADVTIDDVSVASDTDGNFASPVSLQNGLNTIRVGAKSKLGKQAAVTRSVLATIPAQTTSTAGIPQATFAGVAVLVSASRNLALDVVIDGKTAKQILLAGSSQLFQGSNDVTITTSDAGATALTITNNVMVAKHLAKLGGDGEVRTNQDFTPSTSLP